MTDQDRFELARQRLAAPKPADRPLSVILAEQRDRDAAVTEITSTPVDGVTYRVRIDAGLNVFVHHDGQWNHCGRLDCTPGEDSLQLIADHFSGQLAKCRRIERNWRGPITPERIAADCAEAWELDEAAAARKKAVRAVIARKAAEAASVNPSDRSFAAMQHRVIRHDRQIYDAGVLHHNCCGSLADIRDHVHAVQIDHAEAMQIVTDWEAECAGWDAEVAARRVLAVTPSQALANLRTLAQAMERRRKTEV
jgi:hypothetical protein